MAEVSSAPLSVDALLSAVTSAEVGGVGLFVGVVRDHHDGQSVIGLDYEGHPSARAALQACANQVAADLDVVAVAVAHRVGELRVGDLAVIVAVGAAHRAEALDGCRALIEAVKHNVPIWKHEHLAVGSSVWVGS